MAFAYGTPKTASGFTLPTTTTSSGTTGFQFGAAGDAKITKPTIPSTFTPQTTAPIGSSTTTTPSGFNLITNTSTGLNLISSASTPALNLTSTASTAGFNLSNATTVVPFSLGGTTTTGSTSFAFPITTATTAPSLLNVASLSAPTTTSTPSSSIFSLPISTISKPATLTTTTASTAPTISATSGTATITTSATTGTGAPHTFTYAQLEDTINKWTIYLEDEGKDYSNKAKQINAWDRLLITHGEKILLLSNGIERVKQHQEQLDQELDFVLAQQKELDDLIGPLEKELDDIPVTDLDRHRTYQMAETLDTQLKQMSEDLKEIIELLNESNRIQEMENPITQIGRILNVHMNSLQWIDRNTTRITTQLDHIAKMHDLNKRNHEINLQRTYD